MKSESASFARKGRSPVPASLMHTRTRLIVTVWLIQYEGWKDFPKKIIQKKVFWSSFEKWRKMRRVLFLDFTAQNCPIECCDFDSKTGIEILGGTWLVLLKRISWIRIRPKETNKRFKKTLFEKVRNPPTISTYNSLEFLSIELSVNYELFDLSVIVESPFIDQRR